MSPIKRLFRRIPFIRWCAYRHAQDVRVKCREARWAHVQSVLVIIGNSTITWAGIERILDELIAWYQHNCATEKRDHPWGLKSKLAYIRMMQCDDRFTDETREFLRRIRIEAKRLGNERHEIIHGMLWHKGGLSQEWSTQRVIYEGPNARIKHRVFKSGDLQKLSAEIADFAHHIAPKVWVLTGKDPANYPISEIEKALSEFGFS